MTNKQIFSPLHIIALCYPKLLPVLSITMVLATSIHAQSGTRALYEYSITAIDTLSSGGLLLADSHGQLHTFDQTGSHILPIDPLPSIQDIIPYQGGHLLATDGGLYLYRHDRLLQLGALSLPIRHLLETPSTVYVSSAQGLYTFDGYRLEEVAYRNLEPSLDARATMRLEGQYYLLGPHTITSIADPRDTIYQQIAPILDAVVLDEQLLIADHTGIHIATPSGKKQVLLDGAAVNTEVNRLHAPDTQTLLYSSAQQIYRWDASLYDLTMVKATSITNQGPLGDAIYDHWGGLWIAQGQILTCVQAPSAQSPPVLTIDAVTVAGIAQQLTEPIVLASQQSLLEVAYTSTHLHAPQASTSYSIDDGLTWYSSDQTPVALLDLPTGKSSLQLRATIDDKYYYYAPPITLYLETTPTPVWLAALLAMAVSLVLLAALALYRVRVQQHNNDTTLSLIKAERKAVQEEQRALQLQMNPHFLFNAMTSIKGLLDLGNTPEASQMLTTYAHFMRGALEQSRSPWIDLAAEVAFIDQYIRLEQLCRGASFGYTIDYAPQLLEDDIQVLPMILQPFIENAIVHGTSYVTDGHITISITEDDSSTLTVTITDNGPGYDHRQTTQQGHESVALAVITQRLREHGGSYTITDTGAGTRVDVLLPTR